MHCVNSPKPSQWKSWFFSCLLACGLGTMLPAHALSELQGQPQMHLPRAEMFIGMHRLEVQVAATPETRQTGLMFRKNMPAHEGMLFVFERAGVQCFWMRNTLLPLTAAFLDDDGTIVNMADMQPMTEASHCSAKPVRYVLEMNQDWFAKRNIQPGTKIQSKGFAQ